MWKQIKFNRSWWTSVRICKLAGKYNIYAELNTKFSWRLVKVRTYVDFIVWLNKTEIKIVHDTRTLVYIIIFKE